MNVSGDLFQALRALIPDLPESTTRLVLTLAVDEVPTIECEALVIKKCNDAGWVTDAARVTKRFSLWPEDGGRLVNTTDLGSSAITHAMLRRD